MPMPIGAENEQDPVCPDALGAMTSLAQRYRREEWEPHLKGRKQKKRK
jgi:hypothetical protein